MSCVVRCMYRVHVRYVMCVVQVHVEEFYKQFLRMNFYLSRHDVQSVSFIRWHWNWFATFATLVASILQLKRHRTVLNFVLAIPLTCFPNHTFIVYRIDPLPQRIFELFGQKLDFQNSRLYLGRTLTLCFVKIKILPKQWLIVQCMRCTLPANLVVINKELHYKQANQSVALNWANYMNFLKFGNFWFWVLRRNFRFQNWFQARG